MTAMTTFIRGLFQISGLRNLWTYVIPSFIGCTMLQFVLHLVCTIAFFVPLFVPVSYYMSLILFLAATRVIIVVPFICLMHPAKRWLLLLLSIILHKLLWEGGRVWPNTAYVNIQNVAICCKALRRRVIWWFVIGCVSCGAHNDSCTCCP
jgi:hypothetical protein